MRKLTVGVIQYIDLLLGIEIFSQVNSTDR